MINSIAHKLKKIVSFIILICKVGFSVLYILVSERHIW